MNNIEPRNSKNQYHGYQEWYWDGDGDGLSYRGYRKNYLRIGYTEYHRAKQTNFYII